MEKKMLRYFLRKVAYALGFLSIMHLGLSVAYADNNAQAKAEANQKDIEKLLKLENKVQKISQAIEKVVLEEESKEFQNSNPQAVLDGNVNIYLKQADFKEVLKSIAPAGWNIVVDIKNKEVFDNQYMFISTSSRRESLFKFLDDVSRSVHGVNLQSKWFFDLKDEKGFSSPTLLVFEQK